MKQLNFVLKVNVVYFENNIDPFVPELWSREVLALLHEQMIAPMLVHRDFENKLSRFGQVLNVPRPKDFVAVRKRRGDAVTVQDTDADEIQVKMDQHIHTSFKFYDTDRAYSMQDLIEVYMMPAAVALARQADRTILGQYPAFLAEGQMAGRLNGLTSSTIKDAVIDTRQVLDESLAPEDGRHMILSPRTEADMLRPEWFTSADKVGDNGTALKKAMIGEKLGFNFYKSLNMGNVPLGNTRLTGAINLTAGYAAGTTTMVVDGFSTALTPGQWVEIDGLAYRLTAQTTTLGNTTGITIDNGLKKPVADNAVIYAYTAGAVNFGAGYAAGWDKAIVVDGFTVAPKKGQLISFGSSGTSAVYCVVDDSPSTTSIKLDRPLEVAIADDDKVNIGPAGAFNMAFTKNAIAFVNRPLPQVKGGPLSSVTNYRGLSLRAVMSYNADYQYQLITLDMLCGVKVMDTRLGAVMLG